MINSSVFASIRVLLAAPFSALAAALALVALQPAAASACSCMQQTPEEAGQNATAIFEGRVTRIEDPQGEPKVVFQVVRSFKGPSHESLDIRTGNSSAACGYAFEEGKSYLVYANDADGVLSTSLCSRTQPIEHATDDLAVLGLGVTPFDPGPGSDQQAPTGPVPAAEPTKAGCASCTIGAREHDAADAKRGMTALVVLVLLALPAGYRITSRRRFGSRS